MATIQRCKVVRVADDRYILQFDEPVSEEQMARVKLAWNDWYRTGSDVTAFVLNGVQMTYMDQRDPATMRLDRIEADIKWIREALS